MIDCANKVLKFQSVNLSVDLQHTGCTVRSLQVGMVCLVTAQKVLFPPECKMEVMVRPSNDLLLDKKMTFNQMLCVKMKRR